MLAKGLGQFRKIVEQFTKQAAPFDEKMRKDLDSLKIIVEISKVSSTDQVLDVACGPGILTCEVAKHARHVIGIDITSGMIERAKLLQKERNLSS